MLELVLKPPNCTYFIRISLGGFLPQYFQTSFFCIIICCPEGVVLSLWSAIRKLRLGFSAKRTLCFSKTPPVDYIVKSALGRNSYSRLSDLKHILEWQEKAQTQPTFFSFLWLSSLFVVTPLDSIPHRRHNCCFRRNQAADLAEFQ